MNNAKNVLYQNLKSANSGLIFLEKNFYFDICSKVSDQEALVYAILHFESSFSKGVSRFTLRDLCRVTGIRSSKMSRLLNKFDDLGIIRYYSFFNHRTKRRGSQIIIEKYKIKHDMKIGVDLKNSIKRVLLAKGLLLQDRNFNGTEYVDVETGFKIGSVRDNFPVQVVENIESPEQNSPKIKTLEEIRRVFSQPKVEDQNFDPIIEIPRIINDRLTLKQEYKINVNDNDDQIESWCEYFYKSEGEDLLFSLYIYVLDGDRVPFGPKLDQTYRFFDKAMGILNNLTNSEKSVQNT